MGTFGEMMKLQECEDNEVDKSFRDNVMEIIETKMKKDMKLKELRLMKKGVNGHVYAAVAPENMKIAIKVVTGNNVTDGEKDFWPRMKHKNILQMLQKDYFPELDLNIFISPLLRCDLDFIIKEEVLRKTPRGLKIINKWLLEILSAIFHLHGNGFCHLAIKASSILISNKFNAVLCDFHDLTKTGQPTNTYKQPFNLRPPEVCNSLVETEKISTDGFAFDVWSVGMLSMRLFTGNAYMEIPVNNENWFQDVYQELFKILQKKQFTQICKKTFATCNVDEDVTSPMVNFVTSCLRFLPGDRPSIGALMDHKYLDGCGRLLEPDPMWLKKSKSDPKIDIYSEENQLETISMNKESVINNEERHLEKDQTILPENETQTQEENQFEDILNLKIEDIYQKENTLLTVLPFKNSNTIHEKNCIGEQLSSDKKRSYEIENQADANSVPLLQSENIIDELKQFLVENPEIHHENKQFISLNESNILQTKDENTDDMLSLILYLENQVDIHPDPSMFTMPSKPDNNIPSSIPSSEVKCHKKMFYISSSSEESIISEHNYSDREGEKISSPKKPEENKRESQPEIVPLPKENERTHEENVLEDILNTKISDLYYKKNVLLKPSAASKSNVKRKSTPPVNYHKKIFYISSSSEESIDSQHCKNNETWNTAVYINESERENTMAVVVPEVIAPPNTYNSIKEKEAQREKLCCSGIGSWFRRKLNTIRNLFICGAKQKRKKCFDKAARPH